MRSLLLGVVSLAFFLAGCKSKNAIPSDVLPAEKMRAVLWDLMRADQFVTDFVVDRDSARPTAESIRLYSAIFSLHHITKPEFQRSFSFYKTHPSILRKLMDSISRNKTDLPIPYTDTGHAARKISPVLDTQRPNRVRSINAK